MEFLNFRRRKMKTKCQEMMSLFLKGDRTEEVMKHLRECGECRELAALDRMLDGKPERMAVPEELDRAVLAYAAAKKRQPAGGWHISFILSRIVIPAAAAAVVCAGLSFAFRQPVVQVRKTLVQVQNQQFDMDAVDSEVLMLSSRIQDTAARLNRTAVISAIGE